MACVGGVEGGVRMPVVRIGNGAGMCCFFLLEIVDVQVMIVRRGNVASSFLVVNGRRRAVHGGWRQWDDIRAFVVVVEDNIVDVLTWFSGSNISMMRGNRVVLIGVWVVFHWMNADSRWGGRWRHNPIFVSCNDRRRRRSRNRNRCVGDSLLVGFECIV